MKVRYSSAAQRDRLRQVEYIERFSYQAADRLDARIEQQVRLLGRFPRLGHVGQAPDTFHLPVSHTSLLLIYRIDANEIVILRLLHGAQDWPGRF